MLVLARGLSFLWHTLNFLTSSVSEGGGAGTEVSWRAAKQVGQEENVRGVAEAVSEESGKTSRGPGTGHN